MSAKSLKNKSRTDWDKIDAMNDDDIDCSDIPELDKEFWAKSTVRVPKAKPQISIRLDSDVLEWFRAQGTGYQTRMNAVLRTYMEAHKA